MDATLQALGQILLGALPTFVLVVFLHFYLKSMFFKPLQRVLEERKAATEGARDAANAALDRAARRAAEYEEALRAARNEIYKEQEEQRRRWREEQGARVAEARRRADAMVREARVQLAAETAAAQSSLETQSRDLAAQITRTILQGAAR